MIAGVMSDTHGIDDSVVRAIVQKFKERGATRILHCGDIDAPHVNHELLELPVCCALNAEQLEKPAFKKPPPGWVFTVPGGRIIDVEHIRMYLGHKRTYDFLQGTEKDLMFFLDTLRKDYDGLRWAFSGHTHNQTFVQTPLVNFVNPGAVEYGYNGYEFAVVNTVNSEVVFSRLAKTKSVVPTFSVMVISDSLRISKDDPGFWEKLTKEALSRDAGRIIHCGNIADEDVGQPELEKFEVHYNLRPDQLAKRRPPAPPNWHLIDPDNPIVEFNGYRFYVQLDLGISMLDRSEIDMHDLTLGLRRQYNELDFVLCGFTHNALLVEQEQTYVINPGDIVRDRNFAVICLPRNEITFGHVPLDPIF